MLTVILDHKEILKQSEVSPDTILLQKNNINNYFSEFWFEGLRSNPSFHGRPLIELLSSGLYTSLLHKWIAESIFFCRKIFSGRAYFPTGRGARLGATFNLFMPYRH